MSDEQVLILCDDDGTAIGYAPRSECHTGAGRRHLAIMVFLRDPQGRVSLQRRRHALWDDLWDLGGATHPLHTPDGDETLEAAARRCLRTEWNVDQAVERRLAFSYRAEDGKGGVEYEHCVVFMASCDELPDASSRHAYEVRWNTVAQCLEEIGHTPDRFTPWAREALRRLAAIERA